MEIKNEIDKLKLELEKLEKERKRLSLFGIIMFWCFFVLSFIIAVLSFNYFNQPVLGFGWTMLLFLYFFITCSHIKEYKEIVRQEEYESRRSILEQKHQ